MRKQPEIRHHNAIPWLIPVSLFVFALVLRVIYLLEIDSLPLIYNPLMDESYHVTVARQILDNALPAEPYYRAPGYLYYLAGLFALTGSDLFWSRVIQTLIGSLLPVAVYFFGRQLLSARIALAAGFVAVLYPTFLYYDAQLLITSLKTLLFIVFIWQFHRADTTLRYRDFIIAGILLGLAGLARPNMLVAGPALAIWALYILRPRVGLRGAAVRYGLMGLAAVIIVAPVTIRNYVVGGEPVMIAWQGGFNFYLGNNRTASGWSATAPGIDQTWLGGYKQSIAIPETELGRHLTRTEISDYWYDRGWDEIAQDPSHFVFLVFKKLRLFFNGYEIPNNQDEYLTTDYSYLLNVFLWRDPIYFPYGLLAPLALIGIALTLRHWRKYLFLYLIVGAYIISFLFFFVCARYRQPLIPIFILFAAYAVDQVVQWIRRKEFKQIAVVAAVFLALAIETNHDMLGLDPVRVAATNHAMIGEAYLEGGNTAQAAAEFRRAIAVDPTFVKGHNSLGAIEARRGNLDQAEKSFRQAIQCDPTEMEAYANLATVFLDKRQPDAAILVMEQARRIRPLDDNVHLKLALTYYEAGRFSEALQSIKECLRLNPTSETALQVKDEISRAALLVPPVAEP